MKRISLKEMLAMAAVVATSGVAYAAPEANITLTFPSELPEKQEALHFLYTEWSEPVNYSSETVLTIVSQDREVMVNGHFAENEMGEPMASVYINLDEEITKPGMYILTIPEGVLYNGETYDASSTTNEQTIIKYLIEEAGTGDDPTVTLFDLERAVPTDGSTVSDLSAIELYWNVSDVAADTDLKAIVRDAQGNEVAEGTYDIDVFGSDTSKIMLFITPTITAEGTYTITIPQGAAWGDNLESVETVLTYTIGEGGSDVPDIDDSNVTYSFNPIEVLPNNGTVIDDNDGSGKGNLSSINITFPAFPYVKEGYEFVLTNELGETFPSAKPTGNEDETVNYITNSQIGNTIIIGVENLPSGTYTLTVPKGVIGDNAWAKSGYTSGKSNEEFSYSWTYTAKEVVVVPEDVKNAPLELTVATLTLPNGEVIDLLKGEAALENLSVGSVFTFATNKDEYAQALCLNFVNDRSGENLWAIWTTPSKDPQIPSIGVKGDDGLFRFEKGGFNVPLYENVTYTLSVGAYVNYEVPDNEKIFLQQTELEIKGLTPGLEVSDVLIENVTPAPGAIFNEENRSFTVVYSGPVEIVTQGTIKSGYVVAYEGIKPFESIIPNEDQTEWTFTIPVSELEECLGGGIVCNVVANDMQGRRVYPGKYDDFNEYNQGSEEDGYQQFTYNSYLGLPAVTVSPASSVVKDLYTFEFTCPEADKESIGVQGIDDEGNATEIVLLDAEGNKVATVDRKDYVEIGSDGNVIDENTTDFSISVTKIIMHLDKEITAAGEYTLVIPANYFMTGTEYSAYGNRPQEIKYTIDPTTGVAAVAGEGVNVAVEGGKVVVTGVEGAVEVYAVSGAKVASVAAQGGNAVVALEKGIYVVVANGKSVKVVL